MATDSVPAPAKVIGANIFLVGLMGAGKTSVGKLIARRLGKTFYDCDQEIERVTGVRIPVIFEIEGETGFRMRERKMLDDLAQRSDVVVATGGGAILAEENRALLKEHGTVVYLCASPQDLWQRTRHDRNRPLLQTPNPLATLRALYAERDPWYREIADVVMDTGNQSLTALAHRLEQKLAQCPALSRTSASETAETKTCAP